MTVLEGSDEFPVCPKCNRQHIRKQQLPVVGGFRWVTTCKAHKTDGMPCMKYPVRDMAVCRQHGVNQAALAARDERDQQRKAASALAALRKDRPPVESIDPFGDLLTEVWTSSQAVQFWAERVGELEVPDVRDHIRIAIVGTDDDAVPMEVLGDAGAIIGPDRFGELRTHPYVKAWDAERDRHAKICKLAIDAGVDERLVDLAEAQGQLVAGVFERVFGDATVALTAAQRAAAIDVAGRELRKLAPAV